MRDAGGVFADASRSTPCDAPETRKATTAMRAPSAVPATPHGSPARHPAARAPCGVVTAAPHL